eukprot:364965-Chlamydomonas_euryale.AAC.33
MPVYEKGAEDDVHLQQPRAGLQKRRSQEQGGLKGSRNKQIPDGGIGTSEDEGESQPDSGSDAETDSVLTGNALTPGTTFMLDVSTSLKAWAAAKLERMRHIAIEVSDATVPGEGEVKILGRLANHWHPVCEEDTHGALAGGASVQRCHMLPPGCTLCGAAIWCFHLAVGIRVHVFVGVGLQVV